MSTKYRIICTIIYKKIANVYISNLLTLSPIKNHIQTRLFYAGCIRRKCILQRKKFPHAKREGMDL